MLEATKKHRIKAGLILHLIYDGHVYNIPQAIAEQYEDKSREDNVSAEHVFAHIEKQYTKAGVLLRGTRHREGLTQIEMAKKLQITQSDLSKMESGKRTIGKVIAKRIEKVFGVNYRYFL